ncbi:MAG: hypothetical protein FJX76_22195 [Armatimonadetes bacterium]|nr:hypothetical protein [Armatimonadota bacterium]
MINTQERNNVGEQVTEAWLQALGNICWAQEQGDKIVQMMLEQGKVTREEGLRMADRLASHIRQNQEEMQRWVQSSVQMSMAAFRTPTTGQIDDLNRKIEDLTKKVEVLTKKG